AKSNNRSDDSHHFNFTRQKSDLTHSKTSENVALGGKSSKASVRSQLRGSQKNHLQLLKSVASPRLPKSTLAESNNRMDFSSTANEDQPAQHQFNGPFRLDNPGDNFPNPPAQFCNDQPIFSDYGQQK